MALCMSMHYRLRVAGREQLLFDPKTGRLLNNNLLRLCSAPRWIIAISKP
ncbi:MAG: hypothetical protein R2881_06000 [Eubacteriales bacterium]